VAQNTYSAGWSHDSKAIAYFADGKLKIVSVDGGPSRIICDARPEGTPAWHGDNILYVQYSIADRGIYRVNASGGKPERIVGVDTQRAGLPWWPQFLPDGKRYLYLMLFQPIEKGTIDHELRVGSLDGGPPQKVPGAIDSRAEYANGNLLFVRDGTLMAQPFDPHKVRFAGEARPLVDGVHYLRSTGLAAFSVSDNGVLAWRSGLRPSRLAWLDRTGSELKVIGTAPFNADGRLSPDGRRYAVGVVDPKQSVSDIWIYDLDRDSSERVTFSLLDEKAPSGPRTAERSSTEATVVAVRLTSSAGRRRPKKDRFTTAGPALKNLRMFRPMAGGCCSSIKGRQRLRTSMFCRSLRRDRRGRSWRHHSTKSRRVSHPMDAGSHISRTCRDGLRFTSGHSRGRRPRSACRERAERVRAGVATEKNCSSSRPAGD